MNKNNIKYILLRNYHKNDIDLLMDDENYNKLLKLLKDIQKIVIIKKDGHHRGILVFKDKALLDIQKNFFGWKEICLIPYNKIKKKDEYLDRLMLYLHMIFDKGKIDEEYMKYIKEGDISKLKKAIEKYLNTKILKKYLIDKINDKEDLYKIARKRILLIILLILENPLNIIKILKNMHKLRRMIYRQKRTFKIIGNKIIYSGKEAKLKDEEVKWIKKFIEEDYLNIEII